MIFDGILNTSKVLPKNVDKQFIKVLFGLIFTSIYFTPLSADLISTSTGVPISFGVFQGSSFYGISTPNTLYKVSITGQSMWKISIGQRPISNIYVTANRVLIVDDQGYLECRDSIFGMLFWKSTIGNFSHISFKYPTSYGVTHSGKVYAFDFNTGTMLRTIDTRSSIRTVRSLSTFNDGLIIDATPQSIRLTEQTATQALVTSLNYRILSETPTHQIQIVDNVIVYQPDNMSPTPLFALGGPWITPQYYNGRLISISDLSDEEWIIDYPYLIEVCLDFGLIRVTDLRTMRAALEWKEINPNREWKKLWWNNGLLVLLDSNQIITVWDSHSNRVLGSVAWPMGNEVPVGMIYTHDVLSFISHDTILYAMSKQ